jgi:hypothetical protein
MELGCDANDLHDQGKQQDITMIFPILYPMGLHESVLEEVKTQSSIKSS